MMERRCTFLVVTSGKPSAQVEAHLVAEHALRAGAGAVALGHAVVADVAHEVFVLGADGAGSVMPDYRRSLRGFGQLAADCAPTALRPCACQRSNCNAASREYSPPRGQQLRMRPGLDDLAGFHDDDPVGLLHGREAVGDDEGGAMAHRRLERGLDHALAFGVEGAGRFVEEEQRRVLQHRPGDRDPLALPAREADAALAEEGLVALGQGGDEVVRVGGGRGGDHLGVAGRGPAVADVLHRVGREDHAVLRDDADPRAQRLEGDALDPGAVDPHRARLDVVEAQDQLEHACSCRRRSGRPARPSRRARPSRLKPASVGCCGRDG